MLVQKSWAINDIVAIKLSTGEEIMGKVVSEDPGSVFLQKPATIALMSPDGTADNATTVFVPFMLGIDGTTKLKIEMRNIVAIGKSGEKMSNKYLQNTSDLTIATNEMKHKLGL